jgi:hypothetical protein
MLVRSIKKINKIKKYPVTIDMNYQYKLVAKVGTFIKAGENIALGDVGQSHDIYLESELQEFNYSKDKKNIKVQDGEIVLEGAPIFKKERGFGTKIEEILSPINGVAHLDDVKNGLIRIIGEKKKTYLTSQFSGTIASIRKNKNIDLEIDRISIQCEKVFGLNGVLEGRTVIFESNKDINFEKARGKIAYLKFPINIALFEKLIALNVKGIIAHNFVLESSADFLRIHKFPFALIDSFGNDFHSDYVIPDDVPVLIDSTREQVIFQNKQFFVILDEEDFVEIKVGDYAKITSAEFWGQQGKILQIDSDIARIQIETRIVDIPLKFLINV